MDATEATMVPAESAFSSAGVAFALVVLRQLELVSASEFCRELCKLATFFCESRDFGRLGAVEDPCLS